jgi:hypothetical protein
METNQQVNHKKMISIELTQEEYNSTYKAIRSCADAGSPSVWEPHYPFLNRVLLKMMKAENPEYYKNIGPW